MITENNKEQIFRKESLDRINSPEVLDKYIKTTNPSVWVILAAIIVFLIGVIIWSIMGRIENKTTVGCIIENGVANCAVSENYFEEINKDSFIRIDDIEYKITNISGPFSKSEYNLDTYVSHASAISDDVWFYIVSSNVKSADGKYEVSIIFESIIPITFIISNNS